MYYGPIFCQARSNPSALVELYIAIMTILQCRKQQRLQQRLQAAKKRALSLTVLSPSPAESVSALTVNHDTDPADLVTTGSFKRKMSVNRIQSDYLACFKHGNAIVDLLIVEVKLAVCYGSHIIAN